MSVFERQHTIGSKKEPEAESRLTGGEFINYIRENNGLEIELNGQTPHWHLRDIVEQLDSHLNQVDIEVKSIETSLGQQAIMAFIRMREDGI